MVLGSFPVKVEHRVAWGEMDAFGHVDNTSYLQLIIL
jgi:acyl-CoA thioesterase FadM